MSRRGSDKSMPAAAAALPAHGRDAARPGSAPVAVDGGPPLSPVEAPPPSLDEAVAALRRLDETAMNRGSTGNVSVRGAQRGRPGLWVTPTGMGADIGRDDFVWIDDADADAAIGVGVGVDTDRDRIGPDGAPDLNRDRRLQGHHGHEGERGDGVSGVDEDAVATASVRSHGRWRPSSEWPLHRAVYRARADFAAVVHAHSPHATALACLRRPLPAFHYMVAVAGGTDVPLVPYHLFGSRALGDGVAAALRARRACLLANHGLVAAAPTLDAALRVAVEVESLCGVYLQALAVGEPVLLDDAAMAQVLARFAGYGQPEPR